VLANPFGVTRHRSLMYFVQWHPFGCPLTLKGMAQSRRTGLRIKHHLSRRSLSEWSDRGASDMAGKAARVAVEPSGSERDTIGATGASDMAEGWDHDLGGVFSGRAQREAAEIQGGSTIYLCESGDIHRQQAVGRRGDRKRITPLFSSPPLFCST
jgi:hypothetical protein